MRADTIQQVRDIGPVNWVGLWTLYWKEVRRFLKVSVQTIIAPAVQTLLFMAVLSLAWGSDREGGLGVSFTQFLAPGLVMMGVLGQAFANTSSSIIVAKLQGSAVDFLMPPFTPWELTAAFIGGSVTRGVFVALAGVAAVAPFAEISVTHWWAVAYYVLMASIILSAVGLLAGIWAEKFDHLAAITSFIITPLSFLSGTFYSIERLPDALEPIVAWNPFFFLIDGFRFGFIGEADGNLFVGALVSAVLAVVMTAACIVAFRSGWRLKA